MILMLKRGFCMFNGTLFFFIDMFCVHLKGKNMVEVHFIEFIMKIQQEKFEWFFGESDTNEGNNVMRTILSAHISNREYN